MVAILFSPTVECILIAFLKDVDNDIQLIFEIQSLLENFVKSVLKILKGRSFGTPCIYYIYSYLDANVAKIVKVYAKLITILVVFILFLVTSHFDLLT